MQWLIDLIKDWVQSQNYATKAWVQSQGYTTLAQVQADLVRPRFLIRRTASGFFVPSVTWTKVPLDTIVWDSHSAWSPPAYAFQNPRNGYYQVNFSAGLRPGIAPGSRMLVALRRNNLSYADAIVHASQNNYISAGTSIPCELTGAQYLDLWIFHDNPDPLQLDYNQELTYLAITGLI